MDREDPNFSKLEEAMYGFFDAKTTKEKFGWNQPYVHVCQDILRAEWEGLKKQLANAAKWRQDS